MQGTLLVASLVGWRADMHRDGDHMDGWDGAWMWLWTVPFWIGLVALAVWAVYRGTSSPKRDDPDERAREMLAERYARGEISTDQYSERLEALR